MFRTLRPSLFIAALVAFGGAAASLAAPGGAQSASQSSQELSGGLDLDQMLVRLEENIVSFEQAVPSFFCGERIISERQTGSSSDGFIRTTTDSVFRVRRTIDPDNRLRLDESRTIKTIDGKPKTGDETGNVGDLNSPMAVFGVFSGGLNAVSSSNKSCFAYYLHRTRKGRNGSDAVIEYHSLPSRERAGDCPRTETSSGHAMIDTASMRVLQLDSKTRDHEILPGVKGTWEWSVEYAPVDLSGKVFWLPKTIRSKAISEGRPAENFANSGASNRRGAVVFDPGVREITYSLSARYSDYHLLTVASRIVPVTDSDSSSGPGSGAGQVPGDSGPPEPQPKP